MPTSLVKSTAKKYNVPVNEVEKIWNQAKKITQSKFNLPDDDSKWKERHWKYTTKVFLNIVVNKYGNKNKQSSKKGKKSTSSNESIVDFFGIPNGL